MESKSVMRHWNGHFWECGDLLNWSRVTWRKDSASSEALSLLQHVERRGSPQRSQESQSVSNLSPGIAHPFFIYDHHCHHCCNSLPALGMLDARNSRWRSKRQDRNTSVCRCENQAWGEDESNFGTQEPRFLGCCCLWGARERWMMHTC